MVTAELVLKALASTRVATDLNTQTEEHENHRITGSLRGFSGNWVVLQGIGDKEAPAHDLTLVNQSSIQILRKALPME